jgi:hypothetical protein
MGTFKGYPNEITLQLEDQGARGFYVLDSGADSSYIVPESKSNKAASTTVEWRLSLHGSNLATVEALREGGSYTLRNSWPRLVGALGSDFLRQVVLMIDPRSGRFAIWPTDRCSFAAAINWARKNPDWAGSAKFEGEWVQQALGIARGCPTVPISIDSSRLAPTLDTGTSISALSQERLNQVRRWSLFQETIDTFNEGTYCPAFLVPGIRTTFLQEPISLVLGPLDILEGLDGTYGLDFLNQGQWILDEGHQMLAFKRYMPDGSVHLRTPGFYLFWNRTGVWVRLCDTSGSERGNSCELVSIDGKPLSQVLNPPIGDPISPGDLAVFGQQLHELFSHRFRLGLKDGHSSRTVSFNPVNWFN